MNCDQWQMLIQQEIDGSISTDQAAKLHMHLKDCEQCAAFARELQELDAFLKQELAPVDPPANFVAEIMAALPAQPAAQPQTITRKFGWRHFALAAAALLMVAGITATHLWDYTPQSTDSNPVVADNNDSDTDNNPAIVDNDSTTDDASTINSDTNNVDDTNDGDVVNPNNTTSNDTGTASKEEDSNNDNQASIQTNNNSFSGNLNLPTAAYSSQSQGEYSLTMLASYNGYDSLLPSFVSNNLVEYYVCVDGAYQKWQQTIPAKEAPVFIDNANLVPTVCSITNSTDNSWLFDYSFLTTTSPDKDLRAVNRGGEDSGFYVYNDKDELNFYDQDGGGTVCSWSGNSNKVLYTTASGELKVYYAAENISITVYQSNVSCACWSKDGNRIVFAATTTGGTYSNIYHVVTP